MPGGPGCRADFAVRRRHRRFHVTEAVENAFNALGSIMTLSIAFGHLQISVLIFSMQSVPWPLWMRTLMHYLRNLAFFSVADLAQPERAM